MMWFEISLLPFMLLCEFAAGQVSFVEPTQYELQDGDDYYLNMSYCPFSVENEFNFTGRCYCWYNTTTSKTECSIPGPTLIMYNGTSFTLTLTNSMTGDDEICESCSNAPKDPDVINIHTHGLHISGTEDDPFIYILPNDNNYHTYNFDILSSHYPGTHWYHSHWHGAVTYHLSSGAFGALIVKNDKEDNTLYQDSNLYNMKSYIIEFSFFWAIDESNCDCDSSSGWSDEVGSFTYLSQCDLWCEMDSTQRSQSGASYDLELFGNTSYTPCETDRRRRRRRNSRRSRRSRRRLLQGSGGSGGDPTGCTPAEETHTRKYYLVNGQFEPIIDNTHSNGKWYVNEWRIFRLLGAQGEFTFQLYFDEYSSTCEYYLLGRDGVYLNRSSDDDRDLCSSLYGCYYFLQSGGRADIAVKCSSPGDYEINLSKTDYYAFFDSYPRAYETTSDNKDAWNDVLFKFTIYAPDGSDDFSNRVTDLPTNYPEYPDYLSSLVDTSISSNDVHTQCPCYTWPLEVPDNSETENWNVNPSVTANEGDCQFTMQAISNDPALFGINNRVFNLSNEADYYLEFEEIYEFTGYTQTHPLHIHVNHFQLAEDAPDSGPSQGFLGLKGDWFDVFGAEDSFVFRMKAYDFDDTHAVVHCHMLLHEDEGMMTWIQILPRTAKNCNDTDTTLTPTTTTVTTPAIKTTTIETTTVGTDATMIESTGAKSTSISSTNIDTTTGRSTQVDSTQISMSSTAIDTTMIGGSTTDSAGGTDIASTANTASSTSMMRSTDGGDIVNVGAVDSSSNITNSGIADDAQIVSIKILSFNHILLSFVWVVYIFSFL